MYMESFCFGVDNLFITGSGLDFILFLRSIYETFDDTKCVIKS
jgi:hypothetical protein